MENPLSNVSDWHIPDWVKYIIAGTAAYILKPLWAFITNWLNINAEIKKKELETEVLGHQEEVKKLITIQELNERAVEHQKRMHEDQIEMFVSERDYYKQIAIDIRLKYDELLKTSTEGKIERNKLTVEVARLTDLVETLKTEVLELKKLLSTKENGQNN